MILFFLGIIKILSISPQHRELKEKVLKKVGKYIRFEEVSVTHEQQGKKKGLSIPLSDPTNNIKIPLNITPQNIQEFLKELRLKLSQLPKKDLQSNIYLDLSSFKFEPQETASIASLTIASEVSKFMKESPAYEIIRVIIILPLTVDLSIFRSHSPELVITEHPPQTLSSSFAPTPSSSTMSDLSQKKQLEEKIEETKKRGDELYKECLNIKEEIKNLEDILKKIEGIKKESFLSFSKENILQDKNVKHKLLSKTRKDQTKFYDSQTESTVYYVDLPPFPKDEQMSMEKKLETFAKDLAEKYIQEIKSILNKNPQTEEIGLIFLGLGEHLNPKKLNGYKVSIQQKDEIFKKIIDRITPYPQSTKFKFYYRSDKELPITLSKFNTPSLFPTYKVKKTEETKRSLLVKQQTKENLLKKYQNELFQIELQLEKYQKELDKKNQLEQENLLTSLSQPSPSPSFTVQTGRSTNSPALSSPPYFYKNPPVSLSPPFHPPSLHTLTPQSDPSTNSAPLSSPPISLTPPSLHSPLPSLTPQSNFSLKPFPSLIPSSSPSYFASYHTPSLPTLTIPPPISSDLNPEQKKLLQMKEELDENIKIKEDKIERMNSQITNLKKSAKSQTSKVVIINDELTPQSGFIINIITNKKVWNIKEESFGQSTHRLSKFNPPSPKPREQVDNYLDRYSKDISRLYTNAIKDSHSRLTKPDTMIIELVDINFEMIEKITKSHLSTQQKQLFLTKIISELSSIAHEYGHLNTYLKFTQNKFPLPPQQIKNILQNIIPIKVQTEIKQLEEQIQQEQTKIEQIKQERDSKKIEFVTSLKDNQKKDLVEQLQEQIQELEKEKIEIQKSIDFFTEEKDYYEKSRTRVENSKEEHLKERTSMDIIKKIKEIEAIKQNKTETIQILTDRLQKIRKQSHFIEATVDFELKEKSILEDYKKGELHCCMILTESPNKKDQDGCFFIKVPPAPTNNKEEEITRFAEQLSELYIDKFDQARHQFGIEYKQINAGISINEIKMFLEKNNIFITLEQTEQILKIILKKLFKPIDRRISLYLYSLPSKSSTLNISTQFINNIKESTDKTEKATARIQKTREELQQVKEDFKIEKGKLEFLQNSEKEIEKFHKEVRALQDKVNTLNQRIQEIEKKVVSKKSLIASINSLKNITLKKESSPLKQEVIVPRVQKMDIENHSFNTNTIIVNADGVNLQHKYVSGFNHSLVQRFSKATKLSPNNNNTFKEYGWMNSPQSKGYTSPLSPPYYRTQKNDSTYKEYIVHAIAPIFSEYAIKESIPAPTPSMILDKKNTYYEKINSFINELIAVHTNALQKAIEGAKKIYEENPNEKISISIPLLGCDIFSGMLFKHPEHGEIVKQIIYKRILETCHTTINQTSRPPNIQELIVSVYEKRNDEFKILEKVNQEVIQERTKRLLIPASPASYLTTTIPSYNTLDSHPNITTRKNFKEIEKIRKLNQSA